MISSINGRSETRTYAKPLVGLTSDHTLSPEEKRLLLESIAQADRGEFVDADDLLEELDESN